MAGGEPIIALDGSTDATLMDPGHAELGSLSTKEGTSRRGFAGPAARF